MADDVLASLQRRNAEIDRAVAAARQLLATEDAPPQSPPRPVDESIMSAASPHSYAEALHSPLSPSVRAAASASAARRTSEARTAGSASALRPSSSMIPRPGRSVANAPPEPSATAHTPDEPSALEEVDPSLPVDMQLKLLRSQCRLARKISVFCSSWACRPPPFYLLLCNFVCARVDRPCCARTSAHSASSGVRQARQCRSS
jgi:hypothetical protein